MKPKMKKSREDQKMDAAIQMGVIGIVKHRAISSKEVTAQNRKPTLIEKRNMAKFEKWVLFHRNTIISFGKKMIALGVPSELAYEFLGATMIELWFNNKRFKSLKDLNRFVYEAQLLQDILPALKQQKISRASFNKKIASWDRATRRRAQYDVVAVSKVAAKTIYGKTDKKSITKMRKVIERLRRRGVL